MKLHRYLQAALIGAIFSFGSANATIEGWTTDFEAAKKQAAEENKYLMIFFTGSDWCGYCIKLTKDVFSQETFQNAVKDKFILVELDFPKKPENVSKLPESLIAQNNALQNQFAIKGAFPSVFLTDAQGKPFARTGFYHIGPKTYVKHIDELLVRRETTQAAFAEANEREGAEKANTLLFALNYMGLGEELLSNFYSDTFDAIKESSPEQAKQMELKKSVMAFEKKLNELIAKKDHEGQIKMIDEKLATGEFESEIKQQTLYFKSMALMELNKPEEALKTLDEAKATAPQSRFSAQIDAMKNRIQAANPK